MRNRSIVVASLLLPTAVMTDVTFSPPLASHIDASHPSMPPSQTFSRFQPIRHIYKIRGTQLFTCWFELPVASSHLCLRPPACPFVKPGDLFIQGRNSPSVRIWIRTFTGDWDEIEKGYPHPILHSHVLHVLMNGEPRWITRRTASTYKSRSRAVPSCSSVHIAGFYPLI